MGGNPRGRAVSGSSSRMSSSSLPPPLAELSALLTEEPAVRAVIAREHAVAVPEAARALFVAALASASTRRPLLVAVPTGVEADRRGDRDGALGHGVLLVGRGARMVG